MFWDTFLVALGRFTENIVGDTLLHIFSLRSVATVAFHATLSSLMAREDFCLQKYIVAEVMDFAFDTGRDDN